MSVETHIVYICDDCRKKFKDSSDVVSMYIEYVEKQIDLCHRCVTNRVDHSFSILEELNVPECNECKGKGYTRMITHYYGSDKVMCKACNGTGNLPLDKLIGDEYIQ